VWDGNVPLHEWTSKLEESNESETGRPLSKPMREHQDGKLQFSGLEVDESGTLTLKSPENLITWIFEDGTFIPMAKLQGFKSYSIITDHLGTPIESYDEDGEKVWSRELGIYGQTRNEFGEENFIPFLYQGQYLDTETELAYNRFRYYDPSIGLFISQDPIGLHGNMPNFYSYVEDSNSWVDPVGLMPWGFMNGASATITAGSNSGTFTSSSTGHAEINGLNSMANAGHLSGQDVVISDVIGHFPEGTKDVGVCTNCRSNIFDPLQRGGANSVTFPVTKGNQVVGSVKIESKDFAKVQAGIDRIRKGSGTLRQKSDAAWDLLQKNSVCH
jgi:RHS repeat-associated protein